MSALSTFHTDTAFASLPDVAESATFEISQPPISPQKSRFVGVQLPQLDYHVCRTSMSRACSNGFDKEREIRRVEMGCQRVISDGSLRTDNCIYGEGEEENSTNKCYGRLLKLDLANSTQSSWIPMPFNLCSKFLSRKPPIPTNPIYYQDHSSHIFPRSYGSLSQVIKSRLHIMA